jgi:Zn-ribbon-containing, possibly nucleic-acid-binding protein (DUF2310)
MSSLNTNRDPYECLRPESVTPDEDVCKCPDRPPITLQDHLSANPISCLRCNLEVPPERIRFPASLAEQIAFWRNLHRALDTLWLDSGEYEPWARAQFENPQGEVNVRGVEIVEELQSSRRSYYWWFEDASEDDFVPPSRCPRCSGDLVELMRTLVCERCSIAVHRLT